MLFQVMESKWIQATLRLYSVGPSQSLSMMLEVFMGLLPFINILSRISAVLLPLSLNVCGGSFSGMKKPKRVLN